MNRSMCLSLVVFLVPGFVSAEAPPETTQGVTSIYAMDADGGNVREIATISDYPHINSPEVSPNGQWIAVDGWKAGESYSDARILLVNVANGAVVNLVKGCMPSWSADGKWIAFCKYSPQRGVYIRSLNADLERHIDSNGWGIQWAPNGLKASYTRGGRFVIYDFIGDTEEEITLQGEWPYSTVYWNSKWSSDSKQICFLGVRSGGGREIGILDFSAGEPRLRVRWSAVDFNSDIGWHPDGTRITVPSKPREGQLGQIYVLDPTRFEPPEPLPGQPDDQSNSGMCWTPDGSTLIFLSRR